MVFGATGFLFLIACLHQSTSTKIEEVKPRWIFNKNSNNSNSLPDLILIDLELESGKITLNLIKQSLRTTSPSLLISGLEGQRLIWEHSENGLLGTYSDDSFDASATVSVMAVDGIMKTLYMITLTHGNESVSLGPSGVFTDDPNLGNDDKGSVNDTKSRVLSINGVMHYLYEDRLINSYKDKNSRFRKRSTEKEKKAEKRLMTIEIFTVIHCSLFEKFFAESKAASDAEKRKDARKFIFYFFTHIMEDVKKMYESIEIEHLKFTTKWVGAFIAETPEDFPIFDPAVPARAGTAVSSIRKWAANNTANKDGKIKLPNYDVLVAFSSVIMEDVRGGMAITINGVCGPLNVAIVRYNLFSTLAKLTAHEIGHLLGAFHDGYFNLCLIEDGYLMESGHIPRRSNNSRFFSSCSVSFFNETVARLDERNNNCLTDGGGFSEPQEKEIFLNVHLGQIYDLNEQCKIEFGPESLYIGGHENDKLVCQKLSCLDGNYTFKAMDGTPCSNGAWCLEGECILDSRAPKVPENCINGDKQYQLDSENNKTSKIDCKTKIKESPRNCHLDHFRTECCLACAQDSTLRKGCQDTLDECSSLDPKQCYHDYYASACCKRCRFFVQNLSDTNCLYGDRIVGCSDMFPTVCHVSSKLCCKTCSDYVSSNKTATRTGSIAGQSNTDFCSQGDYQDKLEYLTVWGERRLVNCSQLVDHDPSVCYNSVVQKYCCASCSNVDLAKDYCKHGDTKHSLTYLQKKFTCRQLVAYNPRLCEMRNTKNQCCESCGRFTVRPPKFE